VTLTATRPDIMAYRVLIVDDNQRFLEFLEEFLRHYADIHIVGSALSGKEALELAEDDQPDLIIVDLWMPDISGLDLTREIKSRWPGVPTIVLTLLDSPQHRQAAMEAGADAFIGKPSMDSDLVPAIERLMA
jgi:DNA-binding NarL/FixJ family response regulator